MTLESGSVLIKSGLQPSKDSGYEIYHSPFTGESFNFATGELDSLVRHGFIREL